MGKTRILIVEDEFLIALEVERVLIAADYDVCGIAATEAEALGLAEKFRPELAVVDINLSPGDGRRVASELWRRHRTLVLFATSQCRESKELADTGAIGCLPKPYFADDVPAALEAVSRLASGQSAVLPDHMFALIQ